MQEKKSQKIPQTSDLTQPIITEIKLISTKLKSISKSLYESNNIILNQLLSVKDEQIYPIINNLLNQILQYVQYKVLITNVLVLLTKIIICTKTISNISTIVSKQSQISIIISTIIDILIVAITQQTNIQDLSLRILQITFSLIDTSLIPLLSTNMLTKIFSICFEFCQQISIIQNISVSALFTLIQSMCKYSPIDVCFQIENLFLQFLFENKIFIWIKGNNIKGLIWDLLVTSIKNFTPKHLQQLHHQNHFQQNINKMYTIIIESIFNKKNMYFYQVPLENLKNNKNNGSNKPYEEIYDFVRYFKAYVALSTSLSIEAFKIVNKQFVPFRATLPKLILICELQRNSRTFVFLQAICHLLISQYDMPLVLQKGMILIQILVKLSEQLCSRNQIKLTYDPSEDLIDKLLTDEPKITDGDFVKQIKNTIMAIRMKFQKDQELMQYKKQIKNNKESKSNTTIELMNETKGNAKKWEIFIKCVIRIIRHLSSINFTQNNKQQDPTRKIILQLQSWYLLCPIPKAKNLVLQQLLITANVLNNKMQAVKVSQSVQIGSNILYGYFEDLDSIGLTIILKMIAGVKADWQIGKSFEQLDEIYNLCNTVFSEEKFVQNDQVFIMIIQAIVQCANTLVADLEQPKEKLPQVQNQQNSLKRSYKMIDYLIQRLIVVLSNNCNRVVHQWNFISAFFITLCFNKNPKIKQQGIKSIGIIVKNLQKTQLTPELNIINQNNIISLYLQLSKSQIKQIEPLLIDQLKSTIINMTEQTTLMDAFKIVKILADNQHNSKNTIGSIYQLQQILIKQCLFRITDTKNLKNILESLQIKSSQKNQQYRLINLLWTIADYFRKITPKDAIPAEFIELWEMLFKNIWNICQHTKQFQTKQSAIHTTTQILAEVTNILPITFVIEILSRYYRQMVFLLLGIRQPELIDSEKHPETVKITLINYAKIFKKLVNVENKSQENRKQIIAIANEITTKINDFFQKCFQDKTIQHLTIQFIFQFYSFIYLNKDDKILQQYSIKTHLTTIFQTIQNILTLASQQHNYPKMDLKNDYYKKKLIPLIKKIITSQEKQKVGEEKKQTANSEKQNKQ